VIAVDDHSTDGSFKLLERLSKQVTRIKILRHERHQGKGAALRTGISKGSADIVPLSFLTTECKEEDGELAYSESIKSLVLLKPMLSGKADAVFGSRFIGSHGHRVRYLW
jgi:glycosyltransferase involved in cell wall biosynthesis